MIIKRISFNLRIFSRCLEILYFYKFKKFNICINKIKSKKNRFFLKSSPYYLSKKINFYTDLLFQNNCFYKSMCLYSLLNDREEVELIIGIRKSEEDEVLSHSWVEINGLPLNEKKLVNEFKPLLRMKKK